MKKLTMLLMMALGSTLYCPHTMAGDKNEQNVYMFGIAAAFGDSVVYFTDIQSIQGKGLIKKGFLNARNHYSYQLKGYMENVLNLPHRTCAIHFSEKKAKLEKTYLKLRKNYQADTTVVFRTLDQGKFQFEKITLEE